MTYSKIFLFIAIVLSLQLAVLGTGYPGGCHTWPCYLQYMKSMASANANAQAFGPEAMTATMTDTVTAPGAASSSSGSLSASQGYQCGYPGCYYPYRK